MSLYDFYTFHVEIMPASLFIYFPDKENPCMRESNKLEVNSYVRDQFLFNFYKKITRTIFSSALRSYIAIK